MNYILLDRNFCNYPLARDPRSRGLRSIHAWEKLKRSDDLTIYSCRLNDGLKLVTRSKSLRHPPSGLETNVLFSVIRLCMMQATDTLEFRSLRAFMLTVGIDCEHVQGRDIKLIKHALKYWTRMRIWFEYFYDDQTKNCGRLQLPSPFKIEKQGRRLIITLHEKWHRFLDTHRPMVKFCWPLPRQANVQNMALILENWLTVKHEVRGRNDLSKRQLIFKSARDLCDRIGITHRHRLDTLFGEGTQDQRSVLARLILWLKEHDGDLVLSPKNFQNPNQIMLDYYPPPSMIPNVRRRFKL